MSAAVDELVAASAPARRARGDPRLGRLRGARRRPRAGRCRGRRGGPRAPGAPRRGGRGRCCLLVAAPAAGAVFVGTVIAGQRGRLPGRAQSRAADQPHGPVRQCPPGRRLPPPHPRGDGRTTGPRRPRAPRGDPGRGRGARRPTPSRCDGDGRGSAGGDGPVRACLRCAPDLVALSGYHSAQVDVEVRLNTNESPLPPPPGWLRGAGRRPGRDRASTAIPTARHRRCGRRWPTSHGVAAEQIFCANGSNEVLQSLLLAYGGPGRCGGRLRAHLHAAPAHRPDHRHRGGGRTARTDDFGLDLAEVERGCSDGPTGRVTFLCSPNNPTGRAEPPEVVAEVAALAPGPGGRGRGLRAVRPGDRPATLAAGDGPGAERVVVVRTFSKTWSMAGLRLGYLVGPPEVVGACEMVALPYHLDAVNQLAGRLALRLRTPRWRRGWPCSTRSAGGWPPRWPSCPSRRGLRTPTSSSSARRPRQAATVWEDLLAASVLVRDCSDWPGLDGCLRVTVGLPAGERPVPGRLDEPACR